MSSIASDEKTEGKEKENVREESLSDIRQKLNQLIAYAEAGELPMGAKGEMNNLGNRIDSLLFAMEANKLNVNVDVCGKERKFENVGNICDLLSKTFELILSKDPNLERRLKHCYKNESNVKFGDIESPIPLLPRGYRRTPWDYYQVIKQVIYHELYIFDAAAMTRGVEVVQSKLGEIVNDKSSDIYDITRNIIAYVTELVLKQYYHDSEKVAAFIESIVKEDKYLLLSLLVGNEYVKYLKYLESRKGSGDHDAVVAAEDSIKVYLLSMTTENNAVLWKLRLSSVIAFFLSFHPNIGIKFNSMLPNAASNAMTSAIASINGSMYNDNNDNGKFAFNLFVWFLQCGIIMAVCPKITLENRQWNPTRKHHGITENDATDYFSSFKSWQPELQQFIQMEKNLNFEYKIFDKIYIVKPEFHPLDYAMHSSYVRMCQYLVEHLHFDRETLVRIPLADYDNGNPNNTKDKKFLTLCKPSGAVLEYFNELELARKDDTPYYIATGARKIAELKLKENASINYWAAANGLQNSFGKFMDEPKKEEYFLPMSGLLLEGCDQSTKVNKKMGKKTVCVF